MMVRLVGFLWRNWPSASLRVGDTHYVWTMRHPLIVRVAHWH